LKQRVNGDTPQLIADSVNPSNLGQYSSPDLFLDNKLGAFEAIAEDYIRRFNQIGFHAYVHIVEFDQQTAIQYWLFYIYNNGVLNEHQGDWEVIQVIINNEGLPQKVIVSQHSTGENADWADVEKVDYTHPVIYVAKGSHANYFRPFQGKIGIENDIVGNGGHVIQPSELILTILGERWDHPPDQSWLRFDGRWGYYGSEKDDILGNSGPLGPVDNQKGIRWELPPQYLSKTLYVDASYFYISWIVANFLFIFAAYIIVRAAWKLISIDKLRKEGELPIIRFVRGRGSLGILFAVIAIIMTVAALATPWYFVTASSPSITSSAQGEVNLVELNGLDGLKINLFLGENSEVSSGFTHIFSSQIPFSIMITAGLVLVIFDIIAFKKTKLLGRKFTMVGVTTLAPLIAIIAFILLIPFVQTLGPLISPGTGLPNEVKEVTNAIMGSPILGHTNQIFPSVGFLTISWGFGIGSYLFILAAIIWVIAALVISSVKDLEPKAELPRYY